MNKEEKKFFKKSILHFGTDVQMTMCIEECAELIQAISKFKRGKKNAIDNLLEEIADVQIMLDQMKLMFDNNDERISLIRTQKLNRLKSIIDDQNK